MECNCRRAASVALLILAVNLTSRFVPLHAAPLETEPRLADIGVNHRTWERIITGTRPDGTPFTRRSAYREIGTGLNYFDPATQTWQSTREEWQAGADGLAALFGPHTATVKNNLHRADAVTLVTPDGVRLVSQPVSIGLYDPVDGHQIVLAEVVDCAPKQTAPNVIIFRNCFDRIHASIRYTYRKAGLSQDLILEEPIALPAGFSDRSRLEFYTAFAPGAPAPATQTRVLRAETDPAARAAMREPDFTDATLFYGEIMRIGPGQAFALGAAAADIRLPVGKTLTQVNGTLVLVEAVEFNRLEPLLAQLAANNLPPGRHANLAINPTRRLRRSADQAAAPTPARSADGPSASPQSAGIQSGSRRRESAPTSATVANAPAHAGGDEGRGESGTTPSLLRADKLSAPPRQGVVIDYEILSSSSLLLKGDTTYLISSPVVVSNLTIEAGVCVKYTNNASIEVQLGGTISCQTTHYRPAIFTAVNDQTVGEPIGTNTALNGYFASTALILHDANHLLQHLRISHAQTAISLDDGDVTLRHSQFEHCQTALAISYAATYWDNVLFHSVSNVVSGDHLAARGQQVTVDECATFAADANTNGSVGLTNTLLARMTNWGNSSFSTNAVVVTNSAGVFQTLGAGAHYLADGSPHRGTGVTNITADLLLALRQRTTWPPLLLTNKVSGSTNLYPAVARITNAPDLGFAYPAVDYAASNFTLTNGTLTIAPGTVLAGFGFSTIWLQDNAQLVCEGTPWQRCHFVPFYAVQEQSTNWGGTAPAAMLGVYPYNWQNAAPSARFRFTDFDSLSGGGQPIYLYTANWSMASLSLQDCSFNSVWLTFNGDPTCTLALTNNLFDRAGVSFLYGPTITAYNNLFRGASECYFDHNGTNTWTFRDNIFLDTTITDWGDPFTHSHNAYVSTVDRLYPTNASDKILTNFTFQSGPLGHYYQSSTDLLDQGSRSAADAGLFHYTCNTNQTVDGVSTVEIGLHYIALGADGLPLDTDGDGLPDYLEDANGNGLVDTNETSYLLADTDGDGLTDYQEVVLMQNQVNPLLWDTDGNGISDADEDSDGDLISNRGELAISSGPLDPYSMNRLANGFAFNDDGAFLFAASMTNHSGNSVGRLKPLETADIDLTNETIRLTLLDATPPFTYDIYYTPNFSSGWQWSLYVTGAVNQTNFIVPDPGGFTAFFEGGRAGDWDGDGLSDGFEVLVTRTCADVWDTDNDGLSDGQEYQLGTNPKVAECPRVIYENVISNQNPSAWFKLNDASLTNAISGQPVTTVTNGGGAWDVDALAIGNGAFSLTNTNNADHLTADDVISGGTGTNQGSMSLLFRLFTGPPSSKRYLFSQKGANSSQEFAVFVESNTAPVDPAGLKVQIGGQTVTMSTALVFKAWYYLAVTWHETNDVAAWYLAPLGGTLTNGTINLATSAVVGSSSNLYLGNRQNNSGTFTSAFRSPGNGALDQIAFWNRELTNSEVSAQFGTLNALFQGPSKVFDLARWELTLPVDETNQLDNAHMPLDIGTAWLNSGFHYVDPSTCMRKYFYRDATNMVFEAPWNGADQDTNSPATSLGSPRSELRGTLANGNQDNWQPLGTNILEATCTVNAENLGTNKVIIGQIHEKTNTSVASIVVNYNYPSNQVVSVTVKDNADGTDNVNDPGIEKDRDIILATGVPLGATFHYKVELVGTANSLTLNAAFNNGTNQSRTMYQNGDPIWNDSTWLTSYFYFKAGCYFPKAPTNSSAKVTFSSLSVTRQP